MKDCLRKWATAAMICLLALMATTAMAAGRSDMTRILPTQDAVQELANSDHQITIDTTWTEQHLAQNAIYSSPWIQTQDLTRGYPTIFTGFIRLDTGSVAIWWFEYYDVAVDSARAVDSTDVVYSASAPLSTAGNWRFNVPAYNCRQFRMQFKAIGGRAAFQPGIAKAR